MQLIAKYSDRLLYEFEPGTELVEYQIEKIANDVKSLKGGRLQVIEAVNLETGIPVWIVINAGETEAIVRRAERRKHDARN